MLKVKNIIIEYNNNKILENATFKLNNGEILALLGSSGSGKSSILKFIAGLDQIKDGSVLLGDKKLSSNGKHLISAEKRKIGMVFQDYSLFPNMNVFKNISFGIKANKIDKKQQVEKLLTLINLKGFEKRYPHELSGGEQQRVALARSLAINPDLILLDEPFSSLDKDHRIQLAKNVKKILKKLKTTVIFVTHNEQEAQNFADKIARIKNKTLIFDKN